ncbi:MAG: glycosyltransferase family 4 protein [Vicinamibacterales bacterium]
MRILLANEARAGAGGVETYLMHVAEALAARGHDVALLFGNTASETGPTTVRTSEAWSVTDRGLADALAQVHGWRPDVVFSHNMRRLDVDEALCASWPVVKLMHGHFGTCVSGQKAFLLPTIEPCTRRCGPACLVLYAPRRCGSLRPVAVVRNYQWAARQRALFDRYRSIVVASEHMRGEYLIQGAAPDRLHAIPLFAPACAGTETAESAVDVLFLGRMTPLKGADVIPESLRVAAETLGRRIRAVIAGDGPDRERLERTLSTNPLIEALFPGWIDASARDALIARARVVIIPSRWPEPFGLVGLEAAAAGVPSIAFNVGGIPEWLTDGVNGRLVPRTGGAAAFGKAIAQVLADSNEYARLSTGARAAAARFSVEAHLTRLERVFDAARRS